MNINKLFYQTFKKIFIIFLIIALMISLYLLYLNFSKKNEPQMIDLAKNHYLNDKLFKTSLIFEEGEKAENIRQNLLTKLKKEKELQNISLEEINILVDLSTKTITLKAHANSKYFKNKILLKWVNRKNNLNKLILMISDLNDQKNETKMTNHILKQIQQQTNLSKELVETETQIIIDKPNRKIICKPKSNNTYFYNEKTLNIKFSLTNLKFNTIEINGKEELLFNTNETEKKELQKLLMTEVFRIIKTETDLEEESFNEIESLIYTKEKMILLSTKSNSKYLEGQHKLRFKIIDSRIDLEQALLFNEKNYNYNDTEESIKADILQQIAANVQNVTKDISSEITINIDNNAKIIKIEANPESQYFKNFTVLKFQIKDARIDLN